jgi:heat shock protein HtpX
MTNSLKTILLMALMMGILLFIGDWMGGEQGLWLAFVFSLVMNFGMYWFSSKIVLMTYRAKEVTEADVPKLFSIVRRLAAQAQLPMPKVYIIPGDSPNAFATGRNPEHAVVAATEGILRLLSDDELEGVIAHELAHVKHRDILIAALVASMAGTITFVARMAMFAADEGGAQICQRPMSLANALRKLERGVEQIPMTNAGTATAHMFIINPLFGGGITKLFSTHPPTEERIARLEQIAMGGIR